jgi:hypothetical protein
MVVSGSFRLALRSGIAVGMGGAIVALQEGDALQAAILAAIGAAD